MKCPLLKIITPVGQTITTQIKNHANDNVWITDPATMKEEFQECIGSDCIAWRVNNQCTQFK